LLLGAWHQNIGEKVLNGGWKRAKMESFWSFKPYN